jgi:two-component sensor histidine kinase
MPKTDGPNEASSGPPESGLIDPVLESHTRILEGADREQEIRNALARVGIASDVDRVYVFEVHTEGDGTHHASQRYEWVREDIDPQIDNPQLQALPLEQAGYGRWVRLLTDYQPVFGLVEEFPEEEQPLLAVQSILSLLVLPIFADGELCGFVGFDDCRQRKTWTRSDVDLLLSLSITIGSCLQEESGATGSLDSHAAKYVAVVRSLLQLRDVAGSWQPLDDMLLQIRARIRALVAAHRYLVRRNDQADLDSDTFMDFWERELRRSLDDCGQPMLRLRAMAAPFGIPKAVQLDLGLLLHELVLAFACRHPATYRSGGISLGMHEERGAVVIRLRLEGEGQDGNHETPDAIGLVLVRRIAQALSGYLQVPAADATARVVIPLRSTAGTE